MTPGWKVGLSIAAGVVALNLLLAGLRSVTGGTPGGPGSSSYATGPDGDAAYASLLLRAGHRVVRERVTPAHAALRPTDTAIVLDPLFVERDDLDALSAFVMSGGRLVASETLHWLRPPLPSPRPGKSGVAREVPFAPVPELSGVRTVVTDRGTRWRDVGTTLPALGDRVGPMLVVAAPGRGRALLLSDSSPLQNRYLARAGNARLALGLAGAPARRVVFFEAYHGYGQPSSGLGAIPFRWKTALLLEAAAVVVFLLARVRRLGPAEAESRALPPPRAEYIRSLAATLARTRDRREALEPLRAELQRMIDSGSRSPEERNELRAALDGDELALGRAFARTGEGGSRRWTS